MLSRETLVNAVAPALVGAVLCVCFARSGFLAPMLLLPLGWTAYRFGSKAAWLEAAAIVLLNAAFTAVLILTGSVDGSAFAVDATYFTVLIASFAWIVAPIETNGVFRIRTAYRLVISSVLSSLATIPVYLVARRDEMFIAFLRGKAQELVTAYSEAAGADVVQRSLIDSVMNVDALIAEMSTIFMRGAAVIGHLVFFYLSWRMSMIFASRRNPTLKNRVSVLRFRLDFFAIWFLIAAFSSVLAGSAFKLEIVRIIGWNALSIGLIAYAAQGYGIALYNLSRPNVPALLRLSVVFLVAVLFLSPGINAVAAGALAALGIAETWLPLRAPIAAEPPSTPGA